MYTSVHLNCVHVALDHKCVGLTGKSETKDKSDTFTFLFDYLLT